jgi:hypothetical protein
MLEEKAHLEDLIEVTTPDIEIRMVEFAWRGYRDLEGHQMGSKTQFSRQHFESKSISVELSRRMRPQSTRKCNGTLAGGRSPPPAAMR